MERRNVTSVIVITHILIRKEKFIIVITVAGNGNEEKSY